MTIKEVADLTGLSNHTLRYYEKEGILRPIRRNDSGHREYNQQEIDILSFLSCLKDTCMSVKSIKEFTNLLYEGDVTIPKRLELLEMQKEIVDKKMADIKKASEHLNWKIDYYKGVLKQN